MNAAENSALNLNSSIQITTFQLGESKFGLNVMNVQEVTNAQPVTSIPKAQDYVLGLINLRGQIVTAIGLYELFGLKRITETKDNMTVICKLDDSLVSLFVDNIGDVIELQGDQFEEVPDTVQPSIKKYLSGVFKTKNSIISMLDLEKLALDLNKNLK